jgi:hypothetical protein
MTSCQCSDFTFQTLNPVNDCTAKSLLNWLKNLRISASASSVSATAIEGDNDNEIVRKSHDDLNEPVDR